MNTANVIREIEQIRRIEAAAQAALDEERRSIESAQEVALEKARLSYAQAREARQEAIDAARR